LGASLLRPPQKLFFPKPHPLGGRFGKHDYHGCLPIPFPAFIPMKLGGICFFPFDRPPFFSPFGRPFCNGLINFLRPSASPPFFWMGPSFPGFMEWRCPQTAFRYHDALRVIFFSAFSSPPLGRLSGRLIFFKTIAKLKRFPLRWSLHF